MSILILNILQGTVTKIALLGRVYKEVGDHPTYHVNVIKLK